MHERDEIARLPDPKGDDPSQRRDKVLLSVVIPVYNEEETLPELYSRLTASLNQLSKNWEVILVNDGSSDRSLGLIREFASQDPRFRYVDLSRNFGHQSALYAGMCRSQGDAVVLMDGDLQDPPEVIPELLGLWQEGNQVVFAVRKKRKESLWKRVAYNIYYRILRSVAYMPIPLDSGDFSLMDRRVVELICELPERNKFLRGLRAWSGFKQAAYEYERDPRFAGETKYTLPKLFRLALDGLLSYSFVPLRVAYMAGLVISMGSFILASFYIVQRLVGWTTIPQGFTTLAVLVLFLGGIQLISIGVLGEYVGRIYEEMKGRPLFVEREVGNFSQDSSVTVSGVSKPPPLGIRPDVQPDSPEGQSAQPHVSK